MTSRPATVHIHHAGDRSVDGILRLIAVAGEDAPLEQALTTMCRELAAITEVDVVSAYVREPDEDGVDRLVMRGNHGFPPGAIGAVRLSFGEGLTGLCAECLRPVSVAVGPDERHFKLVPGLGEQFPAYLGVPLIGGGRALGVLVLQRRARTGFTPTEVTLATALAAPVTLAVERRFGRAAMAQARGSMASPWPRARRSRARRSCRPWRRSASAATSTSPGPWRACRPISSARADACASTATPTRRWRWPRSSCSCSTAGCTSGSPRRRRRWRAWRPWPATTRARRSRWPRPTATRRRSIARPRSRTCWCSWA
ncbi:MAG: GAF domain-containing protein [Myxococcales bacterium]|nr:GAF domain-containing protein [Myxococcales bacterium]